jgi:hypothetical protein
MHKHTSILPRTMPRAIMQVGDGIAALRGQTQSPILEQQTIPTQSPIFAVWLMIPIQSVWLMSVFPKIFAILEST